jgi:Xaa-Pro aminopeptidase
MVTAAVPVLGQGFPPERAGADDAWRGDGPMPVVLPLRDRAAVVDLWLERRLDTVVPEIMRREGIDLWIVAAREYNEDPVIETMLPATWMAARRRTVLILVDHGPGQPVERLAVARYDIGSFPRAWEPERQPDQWGRVAEIITQRDPRRIAVDRSATFALADGLSGSEYDALLAALPPAYRERVVSAERLAIAWLETRIPEEMEVYPHIVRIAHRIISEGLSSAAIQPGVTTTEDVVWWYRERILALGLDTWFQPSVSVQRQGATDAALGDDPVIQPGDVLHCDVGITVARLNTDTQHNAYVLKPGETDAPAGLKRALANANVMQDISMEEIRPGRTGNEILASVLSRMKARGIDGTMYSHPIGMNGHGSGPLIGLWDYQDGVPGRGDAKVTASMWYSIELQATTPVPEWGGARVRMAQEEDMIIGADGKTRWALRRQDRLFLVRTP